MAVALMRGGRTVPLARRIIPLITAAAVFALADVPAVVSLALVLTALTLLAIGEAKGQQHHLAAGGDSADE
jgi:hypothetical protein